MLFWEVSETGVRRRSVAVRSTACQALEPQRTYVGPFRNRKGVTLSLHIPETLMSSRDGGSPSPCRPFSAVKLCGDLHLDTDFASATGRRLKDCRGLAFARVLYSARRTTPW